MEPGYRRCCGIDVHKDSVTVTVLPPAGRSDLKTRQQVFRTFTRNLRRLRGWLLNCGVTEVAMESTGQYWRAVWNVLEGRIPKMLLLNPLHVKALEGEKTDAIDSERIATLLQNHELRGSFVPPREIQELRELLRGRVHLLEEINRVKNRSEQLCQSGNIKLSSVATDIFGRSGRQMLEAVIENQRDPGWMADYARSSMRGKKAQLELALEGTFTDHQRWMLKGHLEHLDWLAAKIALLESEVRDRMTAYASQVERLNTIPGIDELTAWTILAEMGPEAAAFPDAKHAASWAGLCPGNHESAGKSRSGRTTHGNPYLRRALCQAAWASTRAKGSYPAALYRRIRSGKGHQSAIIAVAHYLLVVSYELLRKGGKYVELGGDYFDQRNKPKVVKRLVQRLNRLGYYADLTPVGAAAPDDGSESRDVSLSKVAESKGFPAG